MSKGLERVTLPIPGRDFSSQDEAQLRRMLEQFMATADGRIREMQEELDDHEARITALEP